MIDRIPWGCGSADRQTVAAEVEFQVEGEVEDSEPALAGLLQASVFNLRSTGPWAGSPVLRVGRDPSAPWVTSRGALQAHFDGFDLHAGVAVPADDRDGLERLCRYELRPAIAQERLSLRDDGRVFVELPRPWHDGTTDLVCEPLELLARLASFQTSA
ncbi:MAG: transposase [Deltaproteobacteria bacterium]|nr:transposase [Deltaproteobacteria bacterium]